MAHLIDKDALVAEIENIRKHYIERDDFDNGWNFALNKVLSSLDTIEVKDVDFVNAKMAAESLGISPEEHDKIVDECLYGKEPELVDVDDLPTKKDYRERYKRIAESEAFKKTHEGMSIGEVIPVEGEEPVVEDLKKIAAAEWDNYVRIIDGEPDNSRMLIERNGYIELAKHFFELGLKAQRL